jgi:hypothetical protein
MSDERLDQLIDWLPHLGDGFANNILWKPELLEALRELRKYRDKPLHCPGCNGDHS